MKLWAYILSFYFLGLTLVPCGDTESSLDLGQNLVAAQLDSGHDHGHSCDECSPFCHCHCCHVHVVQLETQFFQIISPEIATAITSHFDGKALDYNSFILQPPKV